MCLPRVSGSWGEARQGELEPKPEMAPEPFSPLTEAESLAAASLPSAWKEVRFCNNRAGPWDHRPLLAPGLPRSGLPVENRDQVSADDAPRLLSGAYNPLYRVWRQLHETGIEGRLMIKTFVP